MKDAYSLILTAIEGGTYRPGDRLVESELAERFGVSRTPVREALQRLETQAMLVRDGRSLIVASLDHNQLAELYTVRAELRRWPPAWLPPRDARGGARAGPDGRGGPPHQGRPRGAGAGQQTVPPAIHLASHNRYLVQQLDLVHRTMALMARTSLAAEGRGETALAEHARIVEAIAAGDGRRRTARCASNLDGVGDAAEAGGAGGWLSRA